MYLDRCKAASVEEGLPTAVDVDETEEMESVRERLGMVGRAA